MKMEIKPRKRSQIANLAEFLALEHDEIITPLHKIAELEELPVFYDDYGDAFDGILVFDKRFYIHLNKTLGNTSDTARGRFTFAHELGHYFIDSHRIPLREGLITPHPTNSNTKHTTIIEREADLFASCILMPEQRFRKDCEKYRKFEFQIIEDLSKKYFVSISACAVRFADIGTHPIMVAYMEDNRIVWKWQSKDFRFWNLVDGKSVVPKDSLAGLYFKTGEGVKRTEELWGIDWFAGISDVNVNFKVYEQLIPYKNKALSVVWY